MQARQTSFNIKQYITFFTIKIHTWPDHGPYLKKGLFLIDDIDIAFELFAMHCGFGRGIRQKKIPQEK